MTTNTYRRVTGLILGAMLGLAYGLTSQALDPLLLPGVPLYQPPLGTIGNALLATCCGAALGIVTAWTEGSALGILAASSASALVIVVGSFLQSTLRANAVGMIAMSLFLAMPFAALLAPMIGAHRWGVNRLVDGRRDRESWPRRLLRPVLLVSVAGAIGALALYPSEGRAILRQTDALLRTGQAAQSVEALPAALRTPGAGVFRERGQGPYALAWENSHIERYRIPRPPQNFDSHTVAVAHFENGWNLVCLYVTPERDPICVGMETLPK